MEQGHARGFAFTAVAAGLSGCNVASPQPWTGKGSGPGPKERLEKRDQGMGLLRTGGESRNQNGLCAPVCLWAQRAKLHMEETLPPSAGLSAQPEGPRQAGSKHHKPKTSPITPRPGFRGTAQGEGALLPLAPETLPAVTPLCMGTVGFTTTSLRG